MLTSDNELLGLYIKSGDQQAFEQLIRRHSAMVMGVCRSLLWQPEDAEDAFQAAFLLLSQKAPKLLAHNSVGGWLHEATYRTCLKLRKKISRTREVKMEHDPSHSTEPWQTISAARENELLHKEILRLPKKYRNVVVLCHLEGKTRAQAASVLDCTTASVKATLARSRKLLRRRLLKKGIAASVCLSAIATSQSANGATASTLTSNFVSESLIHSTLQVCESAHKGLTSAKILQIQSLISKGLSMNWGVNQIAWAGATSFAAIAVFACLSVNGGLGTDVNANVKLDKNRETKSRWTSTSFEFPAKGTNQIQEGRLVAGVALPEQENETAKKATETWSEYIDRLVKADYMTAEQKAKWESGEPVTVEKTIPVTKTRFEPRTRMVNVQRMRNEVKDGKNVQVPFTEQVQQTYTVAVPFVENVEAAMTVPAPKAEPEDATFPGLQTTDGTPIARAANRQNRAVFAAPRPIAAANVVRGNPNFDSRKNSEESWSEYVDRLFDNNYLTEDEYDQWQAGNSVTIKNEFPLTSMTAEARKRTVTVTVMENEVDEDGKTRTVPKQQQVEQEYTVMVPTTTQRQINLEIPAKGTQAEDETNEGFRNADGDKLDRNIRLPIRPGYRPDPTGELEAQTAELKAVSQKLPDETWNEYVDRLVEARIIKPHHRKRWLNGDSVKIENKFNLVHQRQETRTRLVNVPKTVYETNEKGERVPRTEMEQVEQQYTVTIPVSAQKQGAFSIPKKGSKPEDATTTGFIFRNVEPRNTFQRRR